ncbi:unnamed protein product [Miscanthus lutarioriparius]|uniref:Peptidase C14 caspase domain-containing protein n=1 Tax=Miscanthus lutarioriparius TaxID=422564 RepID=A0A811QKU6_9POAL|nr:unnamed protein product [Miscanthus lutarioriparius]
MVAILVGCNYAGTENELQGCINDAQAIRAVLLDRFGFAPADVTVLTDDDHHESGAGVLPTGATVKRTLAEMVARAAPGTCSSSSSAATARSPRPSAAMAAATTRPSCPATTTSSMVCVVCAHVDFRELVDLMPRGATFTMVSNSCHSGGLIDQEKEQMGPDVPADPDLHAHAVHAARFLPAKYRRDHNGGNSGGAARTDDADAGILLSGCQTDELSLEVCADGGRAAYGAFSGALQAVLAAHPTLMSNWEVVCGARDVLRKQEFPQHPCLYCSDANADAPFLGHGQQETKSN